MLQYPEPTMSTYSCQVVASFQLQTALMCMHQVLNLPCPVDKINKHTMQQTNQK
jgi:hypothetical protein